MTGSAVEQICNGRYVNIIATNRLLTSAEQDAIHDLVTSFGIENVYVMGEVNDAAGAPTMVARDGKFH